MTSGTRSLLHLYWCPDRKKDKLQEELLRPVLGAFQRATKSPRCSGCLDRHVWATILWCERDSILLNKCFPECWLQPHDRITRIYGNWDSKLDICSSGLSHDCKYIYKA